MLLLSWGVGVAQAVSPATEGAGSTPVSSETLAWLALVFSLLVIILALYLTQTWGQPKNRIS